MIDSNSLNSTLTLAIDNAIQDLVNKTIDSLVLDPAWVAKIESIVNQSYAQRFARHISTVDIESMVVKYLEEGVDRWQEKLKNNFKTNGITDDSASCQLTVMDGVVVIENSAVARNLTVIEDSDMQGTLTVKNLVVKGAINTDNRSWRDLSNHIVDITLERVNEQWREDLIKEVVVLAKTQGINFNEVLINDKPLIVDNTLNSSITQTNIEKTGVLKDLTVLGEACFNDNTVSVLNRRVGINTRTPEMALGLWDDEVSVLIGKLSQNNAFVGTGRGQSLSLGTNRIPHLEINTDGLVTVKKLQIDRFQIGHATSVPGHSGTKGDLLINSDFKQDQPFAWICLGGFRWQPLKGA